MLITDLLEDIHRFGQDEVEFWLFNKDGDGRKLDLFINDGKYLYIHKDKKGKDTNILIIGLTPSFEHHEDDMLELANRYLSHKDREVRDIAMVAYNYLLKAKEKDAETK